MCRSLLRLASVSFRIATATAGENPLPLDSWTLYGQGRRTASGILEVSVTLPDREEATAIVNAVVKSYMDEVKDRDRQLRRLRIDNLERIFSEKEDEVRTKREQLRQELARFADADDLAMGSTRMAVKFYSEFEHELLRMRREKILSWARRGRLRRC